ncbi:hypothetical protein MTO96_031825 [Rhipicephalus appendiculatus]
MFFIQPQGKPGGPGPSPCPPTDWALFGAPPGPPPMSLQPPKVASDVVTPVIGAVAAAVSSWVAAFPVLAFAGACSAADVLATTGSPPGGLVPAAWPEATVRSHWAKSASRAARDSMALTAASLGGILRGFAAWWHGDFGAVPVQLPHFVGAVYHDGAALAMPRFCWHQKAGPVRPPVRVLDGSAPEQAVEAGRGRSYAGPFLPAPGP